MTRTLVSLAPCPKASILIVLGPPCPTEVPALTWANAAIETDPELELVVVDDGAPEAVKDHLASLGGAVRVLHTTRALGTRAALATAVRLAAGTHVLLVTPTVSAAPGMIDALLAPFGDDPGTGLVEPGPTTGGDRGLIALRRAAIDSLGGPDSLNDRSTEHDPEARIEEGPLLSLACRAKLAAARWRAAVVPVEMHDGGLLTLWRRDATRPVRPAVAVWNPHRRPTRPGRGLNVVGLLDGACGIGDAARRYVEAVAETEVPVATFVFGDHGSPRVAWENLGNGELTYDTNLLVVPPDALASLALHAGRELWRSRYTIGMWFWELETLSPNLSRATAFVNELWASSHFIEDAFRAGTDRSVVHVPLPVRRRDGTPSLSRQALGLPDAFTFLTTFDFGSVALRKNSIGVVRAFTHAFAPGEGPVLVVKTMNTGWDQRGWHELRNEIGARRDIVVLDGYVSDEIVSAMIGNCDCYVSLHRSEGFGLTPAEAMAWGRPVIATGYSGNLDYMTAENSFLVPYQLTEVPASLGEVYPLGARWAEPDLEAAAGLMRAVVEAPEEAARRAARGRDDIRRTNSASRAAEAVRARLEFLAEHRRELVMR